MSWGSLVFFPEMKGCVSIVEGKLARACWTANNTQSEPSDSPFREQESDKVLIKIRTNNVQPHTPVLNTVCVCLQVYEAYGQTECTAGCTFTTPGDWTPGERLCNRPRNLPSAQLSELEVQFKGLKVSHDMSLCTAPWGHSCTDTQPLSALLPVSVL